MSYTTCLELPSGVRNSLSREDQEKWRLEYNSFFDSIKDEDNLDIGNSISLEEYSREHAWESVKYCDSSRYVLANVSTEIVDLDGDLADVDSYVDAGQFFVDSGGLLISSHSNKVVGIVWKVFKGIDEKSGKPCILACMNYFRDRRMYDVAWKEFLEGKTKYSIGSFSQSIRECDSHKCYYRLIPEHWFELSNVRSPRNTATYPVDVNEHAKGDDSYIVEIHDEVCPLKKKYLQLKQTLAEKGLETSYNEGMILINGKMDEDVKTTISSLYPDYRTFDLSKGDGGDTVLVCPQPINNSDELLDSLVHLITDEQEAIQGYNTVMESIRLGDYLDEKVQTEVFTIFNEIIHDEEKHIGGILEALKRIDPTMASSIAEGMKESSEEVEKGECPAGQHEHAGVWGCHDIFREHHVNNTTNATDKLDLTDENIDVNAIQNTPTPTLQNIVKKVATILSRYSDDEVQQFLTTTSGKEFILAFLELKQRKMKGESKMVEKQAGCKEEDTTSETKSEVVTFTDAPQTVEKDKGLPATSDIQSSISNIASTMASMLAVIDQINTRIMKLEANSAENTGHDESIADAILGETSEGSEEMSNKSMNGVAVEDADDKGDVPPQFDKPKEGSEMESEDISEKKVESTDEDSLKEESDGKSESGDKPEQDEKPADGEDKSESTDKEEATSEKKEGVPDSEKKKEEPENDEKKKGDIEVVAETETKVEAETAVKPDSVEAPIVDNKSEEGVEKTPDKDVPIVESIEGKSEIFASKGCGNIVDFRAMVFARQAELKQKGVDVYYAESEVNSLASLTPQMQVNKSNVSLIYPSEKIKGFDGHVTDKPASEDYLHYFGMSPGNFLKKIVGEEK